MLDKNFTQLCLIALLISNVSYADDDTIIVTADRIKSTLDKSPSDVKVFEQADIEKSSDIAELLSSESDLRLAQSGPLGGNTSLFLRGSDSSHTLVIIDGIIMNDPSNPNRQFDLGRLSLNNIERIEILKGSQGLLYGSNAIGGVILITSKKGGDKTTGSIQSDYGTFDTFNNAFNIQKKINKTSFSIGLDHLKTRGFSAANIKNNPGADDDGEQRLTVSTALTQTLTSSSELVFNYRYVKDEVDLDKNSGAGNDDPNDSQFTEQQFLKAGYNQLWDSGETQLFYTKTLHHRTLNVVPDAASPSESAVTVKGNTDAVAINHTQYTTTRLTQNINLDYQHEEDQLKNFNENVSLFLYNRYELGNDVYNVGMRVDSNKYFGEHLTYKLAYLHNFESMLLKLSYSTGFRAPSLNQLYDPTYGNKNLNPEESQSAEAGLEIPFSDRYKLVNTLFYTGLHNRLSYHPITYVNLNRGNARIIGFENNHSLRIIDDLKFNLSLTWLSARDLSSREKLLRRPNLTVKAAFDYKKEKHTITLEGDYTGKRPDVGNVTMKPFTVFNIYYNFDINQSFTAYAKIKNILDHDYEEVLGFGTGGRNSTLGIKYNF